MRGRIRTAVMISFLVLFSATPVFAQPTLLWNGQPWFVEQGIIADGGRLLIDAADLARAMGAVLTYNAPFIEFRWQDGMPVQSVQMGPDSPVALIRRAGSQATEVTLDVMPQVSQNRVLVPLRFLVEKTGGSTQWYTQLETVSVHYGELSLVRLAGKEAELGRMFFDRKFYAESLDHYQEALALGLEYPEMHHQRMIAFHALGDGEQAVAAGEAALRLYPVFCDADLFHRNFPLLYRGFQESMHSGTLPAGLFRELAYADLFPPLRTLLLLSSYNDGAVPTVLVQAAAKYQGLSPELTALR